MKAKTLLGAIILGGVVTTSYYLYRQFSKLKDVCTSFERVQLNKLSVRRISMTIFMAIRNKSSIGATVYNQNYLVFVNNKEVAKISNSSKVVVPPKGKVVMPINVDVDFDSLKKFKAADIVGFISDKSNVKIKISGSFSVKTEVGDINNFPINYESDLAAMMAGGSGNADSDCS